MHRRLTCCATAAVLALTVTGPSTPAAASAAATTAATAPTAVAAGPVAGVRAAPGDDRRLRRALERVVDRGAVGVTAHVVDRGQVWRGAAGSARLGPRRPAVAGAQVRAASVTKQLTAVLALQLVQRGTWTLDTTIGDVLPGLWPERSAVTLGQLLSHTSGVPDHLPVLVARATTPRKFQRAVGQRRTDRGNVEVAKRLDWLFEPGTSFGYSNTGFVIVGMMLRAQTGRPLPALARHRILRPAGMTRSRWAADRRTTPPALREYGALGRGGRQLDLSRFHPSMFSAAGALLTTARDLNRFQFALSSGRLLRRATVARMRSVTAPEGAEVRYGYGSYRIPDPCRPDGVLHGHDGASWGTHTLSFGSADGRRRVTVAMTGRQYTERQPAYLALNRLVVTAFATTCRGGAAGTGAVVPRVDRVAPPYAR